MERLNDIVAECLRGSEQAPLALEREMRPRLVASLQNRGATPSQAEEIAADVLGECFISGEKCLLRRFSPKREFDSWLLRVAINRLIDKQRRQNFVQQIDVENRPLENSISTPAPDADLRRIVKKALTDSFAACDPQVRVLLWLSYAFQVKQTRLARAWGWSESKLSRTLTANCEAIRENTLKKIRQIEPGLALLWEDVIDVCDEAQEGLFRN